MPMRRNPFVRPMSPADVGKKVIIVCEGKKTEYGYFESIRQSKRLRSTRIIVVRPDGTDPLTIVREAVAQRENQRLKRRWSHEDSAWAVYDGDEHIQHNPIVWHSAMSLAMKENIKLAITNPAFEYWYLLHFRDHESNLSRQKAIQLLKEHIPDYEKSDILYSSHLVDITADAISRAKDLHRRRALDGHELYSNPCAHVFRLVEELLAMSSGSRP